MYKKGCLCHLRNFCFVFDQAEKKFVFLLKRKKSLVGNKNHTTPPPPVVLNIPSLGFQILFNADWSQEGREIGRRWQNSVQKTLKQCCFNASSHCETLNQYFNASTARCPLTVVTPGKHETLTQYCFKVGPTLKQHWVNGSCLLGMTGQLSDREL